MSIDSSQQNRLDRRRFLATCAAGLPLAASCAALEKTPGPAQSAGRPNILLIMTDQHRADCLGCDGNHVLRTPHMDRLAKEGVLFRSAYSSTPTCTPARSALLTGLSPWHHGMLGYGKVSDQHPIKMPQALKDAGYATFGIGKMHWSPQRALNGFEGALLDEAAIQETPDFISDYHQWFQKQAPGQDPDVTGIGWNDHRARAYALPEELHPTFWTGQMAVDYIERYDRPSPFFLKVSFHRPHSPYDPPSRFMDLYREEDMPAPHVGDWAQKHAVVEEPFKNDLWHGDLGIDQVRRSRRGYYGSVSFVDEQVGRILAVLEKRGMLANTFILMTADHGDMTGDHHLWRKSYAYEASARIPFLVRWPDGLGFEDRRGQILRQPVELRDVLATFLDVAGVGVPASLDGHSVWGLIQNPARSWRPFIDMEHDICYSPQNHWNALTDGQTKYIFHAMDGTEQLFDLENDPGELHDMAGDQKRRDLLALWRQRMVEHLAERGEAFVREGQLVKRPERMLYSPNFPSRLATEGTEGGRER